jgi:hypothetical protein
MQQQPIRNGSSHEKYAEAWLSASIFQSWRKPVEKNQMQT